MWAMTQESDWRKQESELRQQVQRAETLQQENARLKQDISRLNGWVCPLASPAACISLSPSKFQAPTRSL